MGNLRTKDLTKIGYTNNQLISLTLGIAAKYFKHHNNQQIIDVLTVIKENPTLYLEDEITGKIAAKIGTNYGIVGPILMAYELLSVVPVPMKKQIIDYVDPVH